MESNLARWEHQKMAEELKRQKEKVKTFSKELNQGKWKPKTEVSVIDSKKKKKIKKLPMEVIQSPDKEADDKEEEVPLREGFYLLEERVHCMNMTQSDDFRAYLHQICSNLVPMVRQGRDVEEEYWKVVRSIYWACKAVGNGSLVNNTDPECVARSVKYLNCIAWRQKLLSKGQTILKDLLIEEEEDPHVTIETKEIAEEDQRRHG